MNPVLHRQKFLLGYLKLSLGRKWYIVRLFQCQSIERYKMEDIILSPNERSHLSNVFRRVRPSNNAIKSPCYVCSSIFSAPILPFENSLFDLIWGV